MAISVWVRPSFFNRFASSSFRAFGLMPLHHFLIVGMLYPNLLAMSGCFIPCFRISRACCFALAFGSMPLHHRETVEMFTWMLSAWQVAPLRTSRTPCCTNSQRLHKKTVASSKRRYHLHLRFHAPWQAHRLSSSPNQRPIAVPPAAPWDRRG